MNIINIDQVRSLAPAAFSNTPDSSLSASYAHVTTASVLDALQQDGWQITDARQVRSRSLASVEHRKHEISLTHPLLPTHAEGAPLLRLANSSDGASAFRLIGGFLRAACTNQLYSGIKCVGGVFNHRGGDLENRIVAGARDARANFDKVISRVDLWRSIELSPEQQRDFALRGLASRWPTNGPVSVNFEHILTPRRSADVSNSLWSVFNRTQESLIRGGFDASFASAEEREQGYFSASRTFRRVRKVTGISANERINTQLWELAESVASGQEVLV